MEEPIKAGSGPAPTVAELQADLARLLALLLSNEEANPETFNKEVNRFISIYDPLRQNEVWMSQHSAVVASTYLVSVLIDRFELFQPKQFLQLLHFCASISTSDVAMLFRDGQASCEVLQTMDQAFQSPDILALGAKVLGLAAGSHSKFRAEIATGDGVSLFVEAMKSHSKDVVTLTALFVAMVNICYNNKDNKTTFIKCDGLDVFQTTFVLCNAMRDQIDEQKTRTSQDGHSNGVEDKTESPRSDKDSESPPASPRTPRDVVYTENQLNHLASVSLSLLRNLAPLVPKEKHAEPLIRSLLHFVRVFLNGKPALVASALTCIGSLLATSPSSKTRFVTKWSGIEEIQRLWSLHTTQARVMQPLTVILQLLSKVNANRHIIAQDFLPLLFNQLSHGHSRDPLVLHPTVATLYQLTFNNKTRSQVANLPDVMKTLLASLQLNMPSPRLHAVTSKLLIRLSAVDHCKKQIQAEGGITAILTPMNAYSGDTRVTKFLAQLVNIVLTNSSPQTNTSSRAQDSDSDSDSGSDSSDSDNSSDSSSSGSYSSSDSDSSDSSNESPRNKTTPPKHVPAITANTLPILNSMDLDAAIAELEASTQMKKITPVASSSTNDTSTPTKKQPAKRTGQTPPRSSTPVDSSIDDLNALAQHLMDSDKDTSPSKSAGKNATSSTSADTSSQLIGELESEVSKLKSQLTSSTDELEQVKRENTQLSTKIHSADDTTQLREELATSKLQQEALMAAAHELEATLAKARTNEQNALSELETLKNGIKAENEVMEAQLLALSSSLASFQAQKEAEQAQQGEKKLDLERINSQLAEQLQASTTELNDNKRVWDEERQRLSDELSKMRVLMDSTAAAATVAQSDEVKALREALEGAQKTKGQLEAELESVQKECTDLKSVARSHSSATDTELKRLTQALDEANKARSAMEMEMKTLQVERADLMQAAANHAGSALEKMDSHLDSTANTPVEVNGLESKRAYMGVEKSATGPKSSVEESGQLSSTAGLSSTSNQVFSQPVPSFLAPSASSSSSATGGRADALTSPLSPADHSRLDVNQQASANQASFPENGPIAASSLPNGDITEDQRMKEKGWIRFQDHQSTVAQYEERLKNLKLELDDALAHSLHFQILSIRLDYHSRGDPVPTIEDIRELLTTGKCDAIPFKSASSSPRNHSKPTASSSQAPSTNTHSSSSSSEKSRAKDSAPTGASTSKRSQNQKKR